MSTRDYLRSLHLHPIKNRYWTTSPYPESNMFSYIRYKYSGQRIQIAADTASEPEERGGESVVKERGRREKESRAFKLSSRKIDIFAYIPRIRPLVEVIKRNKAHLYGTPREHSESVGPEIPKIGRE